MEVVELFQDEVQFPYGVVKRVSAPVGTFFETKENPIIKNVDWKVKAN